MTKTAQAAFDAHVLVLTGKTEEANQTLRAAGIDPGSCPPDRFGDFWDYLSDNTEAGKEQCKEVSALFFQNDLGRLAYNQGWVEGHFEAFVGLVIGDKAE